MTTSNDDDVCVDSKTADAFKPDLLDALTDCVRFQEMELPPPRLFSLPQPMDAGVEPGAKFGSSALLTGDRMDNPIPIPDPIPDPPDPIKDPIKDPIHDPITDAVQAKIQVTSEAGAESPQSGEEVTSAAARRRDAVPDVLRPDPDVSRRLEASDPSLKNAKTAAEQAERVIFDASKALGVADKLLRRSSSQLPAVSALPPNRPNPAKQSYSGLSYAVDRDLKWIEVRRPADVVDCETPPANEPILATRQPKSTANISYPTFSKRLKRASLPAQSKIIGLILALRKLFSSHPRLATVGGTAMVFIVGFAHFQSMRESADLVQQGNALLGTNRIKGAITCFDKALHMNPGLLNARLARALAYEKSGNWAHAIADYEDILRVSPDDSIALKRCAWLHLKKADYQQAIRCYQELISAKRGDSLDLLNLANALAADKKHARALVSFDLYLKAHPDNALVLAKRELSFSQLQMYDYTRANQELKEAIKEDPVRRNEYLLQLAQIAAMFKKYPTAADVYSQILAANPNNTTALAAYGWYSYLAGERAVGLAALSRAIDREPSPQAHYWRGSIYMADKQFTVARVEFERASASIPSSVSTAAKQKIALCQLLEEEKLPKHLGRNASNETAARLSDHEAHEISDADVSALKSKAYEALKNGRIAYAVAALSRAIKLSPDDPELRQYMTYALIKTDQPDDALSQLSAWDKLATVGVHDFGSVIVAMFQSRQDESAKRVSLYAISRFSKNASALLEIAKICSEYGSIPEARKAIEAGLRSASTQEKAQFAAVEEGLQKQLATKIQPSDIPAPKS
jgi:tetratricopeptide (TPR) repeat protein